jgi:polysaccharide biosynthesis transport protein
MKDNINLMNPLDARASSDIARNKVLAVEQSLADFVTEDSERSGLSVKNYLYALYKWRWLIIVSVLTCTVLVAVVMGFKADMYEAEALVQVDLENSGLSLATTKGAPSFLSGPVNDPAYFNTQLQILNSPALLRTVVKQLNLEQERGFFTPDPWIVKEYETTKSNILKSAGLIKARPHIPEEEANSIAPSVSKDELIEAQKLAPYVDFIQKNLDIEPVQEKRTAFFKGTRLISIQFQHVDPTYAAKVSNAIAAALVDENQERRTNGKIVESTYLKNRIRELKEQIQAAEEHLIAYANSNQILSLDPSQNTVVDRLVGLNRQLLDAENERKLAEGAYRAALAPGAASALADDKDIVKVIVGADTKLSELKQKREQLLVQSTEEWPEVKETDKQIAVLETFINDTRSRATKSVLTNLETRYRQAMAREDDLRKAFNVQRTETVAQNEAAINYRIIQQEIETNKNLLEGLLQRNKENEVLLAGSPNNIHVMSYAMLPYRPVSPKRTMITSAAFIFMLIFSSGLVLLKEHGNENVCSASDAERWLRAPVLGEIPSATRRGLISTFKNALPIKKDRTRHSMTDVDSSPQLTESYRQLRNAIQATVKRYPFKTLLVTSNVAGEGKTVTAIKLAESLVHAGACVLLVDADMRCPRLHGLMNLENDEGVATLLANDISEAEAIAIAKRHAVNGLFVLPTGPVRGDGAELLDAERLEWLLAELKASFDYIIIDSSPMLTFSDSMLLASVVDEVLLVVKSDSIEGASVRRTRQLLQNVGANIAGVVLNDIDPYAPHFHSNSDQLQYYANRDMRTKELPNGTGE